MPATSIRMIVIQQNKKKKIQPKSNSKLCPFYRAACMCQRQTRQHIFVVWISRRIFHQPARNRIHAKGALKIAPAGTGPFFDTSFAIHQKLALAEKEKNFFRHVASHTSPLRVTQCKSFPTPNAVNTLAAAFYLLRGRKLFSSFFRCLFFGGSHRSSPEQGR